MPTSGTPQATTDTESIWPPHSSTFPEPSTDHTPITEDPTLYGILVRVLQHSGVASPSAKPSDLSVHNIGSGVAGTCFLVRFRGQQNVIKLFQSRDCFQNEKECNQHLASIMKSGPGYNLHCCVWRACGTFTHEGNRVMYAILPYRGLSVSRIRDMRNMNDPAKVQRVVDSFESLASYLCMLHGMGVFHTDLKHDNVTMDEDGNVFLIDWGNAFITKLNDYCRNGDGTYNHLPCARLVPRTIMLKVCRLTASRYDYPITRHFNTFKIQDFAMCDIYGLISIFSDILSRMLPSPNQRIRDFLHHVIAETQPPFLQTVRRCILKCAKEEIHIPKGVILEAVEEVYPRTTRKRSRSAPL